MGEDLMCAQCRDFDKKMYPDMGEGSFLDITDVQIHGMDGTDKFLRIQQERDVTYMGMDGAVVRHEVNCVYIPWHLLIEQMDGMIELFEIAIKRARERNNEN